ncbi:MAG TPA: hypothetical protein VI977_03700 [archaeon]|nr:hypothetical protein [archaeon]
MKMKKLLFCGIIFALFILAGCAGQKPSFAITSSDTPFFSEAQITIDGAQTMTLEKIPSAEDFPIRVSYSVPDDFKWQSGYYEKILVRNDNGEWQEIFVADTQNPALGGAGGHKGGDVSSIPMQNSSEIQTQNSSIAETGFSDRKGILKTYSINPDAMAMQFKFAVFDAQGNAVIEKTKNLYRPFELKMSVFSKTGIEITQQISESDFPIKICYDWSALEKWQYGDNYERITIGPASLGGDYIVLFQGQPEWHDSEKGDDPRNLKKSDCVIVESSESTKYVQKKTENNWSGFASIYNLYLKEKKDTAEEVIIVGMIWAKNTTLGETEKIFGVGGTATAATPTQKDLFVAINFDSALAQKIQEKNPGKTALQAMIENMQVTVDGKKTVPIIQGSILKIPNVGIVPAGQTRQIIISSKINGFTGEGITTRITLNQNDLETLKEKPLVVALKET